MKLKQVALVAEELEPVRSQLFQLLGVDDDFADPGVGAFGLENTVMAVGETFLEVVAPTTDGTTAGRLLSRRGGNGGYMVIALVDDIKPVSTRLDALEMRKVWEIDQEKVSAFHVHPRDIGAAIVSFDEMRPSSEWLWAGPGWRDRQSSNVSHITAVDVQANDPSDIAKRWSAAFDKPTHLDADAIVMPLDEGTVRFVQATDGRGDGVAAVEFAVSDRVALDAAVEALSLDWEDDSVNVCGTRLRFVT